MSVKKIFIVLITIVACVIIGAFVLNILLPNVTTALVDATEQMIYNATSMNFDFNGNGVAGRQGGGQNFATGGGVIQGSGDNAIVQGGNGGAGVAGWNSTSGTST